MRTLLLASIAIVSFAHLAHADGPTFSKTPVTEDFLRQLNDEQLSVLRSAQMGCAKPGALGGIGDTCVTMRTDEAIMKSGNADLQAFHKALPRDDRYNETRDSTLWRAWATGK